MTGHPAPSLVNSVSEALRLSVVRSCGPDASGPDDALADLLALCCEGSGLQAAAITLIDRDQQWPLAAHNIALKHLLSRDELCDELIAVDGLVVARDPLLPSFATRFALPLHVDRMVVGALHALTTRPDELDATERRWLERIARLVEQRLRSRRGDLVLSSLTRGAADDVDSSTRFFQISDQAMAIIEASGRLSRVNDAYCRLLGRPAVDLVGHSVVEFLHRDDLEILAAKTAALVSMGESTTVEARVETARDGYRVVDMTVAADPTGHCYYVVLRDVTDARRLDRLKSEFVSTVSHELRTPLTSIRGALGLATGGSLGEVPQTMAPILAIAERNAARLVRLVNDILDLERMAAGKLVFEMTDIDLRTVVAEAVTVNQPFATTCSVTVEAQVIDERVIVHGDPGRIHQVLTNLISNAARFSPPEGTVQVRLLASEGYSRVEVADQGPGIAPEFQARVFERFSQGYGADSPKGKGSGLGLSICRQIVEAHHGRIGFETGPDVGTTFWFELPVFLPRQPACHGQRRSSQPTLLICEDDHDVAQALQLLVEQQGYRVTTASSAAEARRRLAEEVVDLALFDIGLPDQTGVELLHQLRADGLADFPVIILSGEVLGPADFPELDVAAWLRKPISRKELLTAIKQSYGGRHTGHQRVLHIEDDIELRSIVEVLFRGRAQVVGVSTIHGAVDELRSGVPFDAVILDLGLPDGDGSQLLQGELQARGDLPVILFTGREPSHWQVTQADAALVKSRASEQELVDVVCRLLQQDAAA